MSRSGCGLPAGLAIGAAVAVETRAALIILLLTWGAVVAMTIGRAFSRRLKPHFTWHDASDPPGQNAIDRAGDHATSCIIDALWLALIGIALLETLKVLARLAVASR